MICPNCGTDNRSDARFCRKCGALLKPQPVAAPAPLVAGGAAPPAAPPAAAAMPGGLDGPVAAPAPEEAPAPPEETTPAALPLEPQASLEADAAAPEDAPPDVPIAAERIDPGAVSLLPPLAPELAMVPPYLPALTTGGDEGAEDDLLTAGDAPADDDQPTGPLPALDTSSNEAATADQTAAASAPALAPTDDAPDLALSLPPAVADDQPGTPATGAAAAAPPATPSEQATDTVAAGPDEDPPAPPHGATQPLAGTEVPTAAPPAPDDPFPPLAPGVIVGDRYEISQVVQTGPQHQTYVATDQAGYVRCWACGSTDNMPGETYCNDCGAQLTGRHYRLYETPADAPPLHLPEALTQNRVPGVAQVLDSVQDEQTGRHYLVLEEVVGQPLSAWTTAQPGESTPPEPLPLERVLQWLVQAADLLGDLHKGGAVSCDFSPESLVVLPDDRLMLMDPASCALAGKTSTSTADEVKADVQRVAAGLEQWYHALPGVMPNEGEDAPTNKLSTPEETPVAPPDPGAAGAQTIDTVLARGRAGGYATAPELAAALRDLYDAEVPPRDLQLTSGRASDVGVQRQLNEDSVLVMEVVGMEAEGNLPAGVYIVADGMGGHQSGEVASSIAIRTIGGMAQQQVLGPLVGGEEHAPPPDRAATFLREAILAANSRIAQLGRERRSDLGTTVTMALILGNQATIANVGDSRTYLWRDGKLQQISRDHSLVARLIAAGQLTPEEGRHFDRRNEIYRALGDPHLTPDEVDVFQQRLRPFDALVLCSDGLWEMVRDDEIEGIMLAAPDLNSACQSLVAAANKAGGEDNISVIIVQAVTSHEG